MQNRLREIRTARGMTLQQVADRIKEMTGEEVTRTQLSRLELGTRKLSVPWMAKLAAVFGVDSTELIHPAVMAMVSQEVAEPPPELDQLAKMARTLGAKLYKVLKSQVTDCGLADGDLILVKEGGRARGPEALPGPLR